MAGVNICMKMEIFTRGNGSMGKRQDSDSIFLDNREISLEFGVMTSDFMVSIKI
jgi:hypothetical protein